ncbi:FAD/NAD(P)-binding domain-containing protein [Lindgomyces ingoldianus]|uniref:FAD/NAD(P)-binding domain-containing protein n=1 Tax=Lindgomyces ingoldianus TaxID=673940 RepID=A0ACB6QHV1_9PLEO|nr:FAD/NAD(P)-binding domain-containing protein [Lindgomyces ingoldianus]KAF2465697.1 FAD/NAD(P)-binding domain-containing protein [Lindgomyces ingoldianus]
MNISIVGAGIAGLAAAIALRRAGHNVEIYEKSQFKNEIGAAILLTPNGNRILRKWGFDFERARPVDFGQFRFVHGESLKVVIHEDFSGVESRFGDRMCAYHRVDLHTGLRDLAEREREGWAPPAKIKLGAEVVGVDAEKGELTLSDGIRVEKDLVVLADGCHCPFLLDITGENTPSVKIGKSVYRWLAPFDKVKEHPVAKQLWENQPAGFCSFFNDNGIFMVTYPCRNSELLNCAVFHDTRPDERDKDDWNANTTHEKVLEALEGFSDAVRNIPLTTPHMKAYTVTQRPPSTRIHKGKVLAIGDTVHHMLPTHAQGGVAALEDAAALEVLFDSSRFAPTSPPSPSTLEARLKLYTTLRLPRSATMQILSSTNPRFTMANLATKNEEIRKFYQGDLIDWPLGCTSWSEPIREFIYGYDVFSEAEKAMEFRERDDGKVPDGVLKWFGEVDEKWTRSEYAGLA